MRSSYIPLSCQDDVKPVRNVNSRYRSSGEIAMSTFLFQSSRHQYLLK